MWHLIGVAARICFEQGLHREATYRVKQSPDQTNRLSSENVIRAEVRRRCFFCVVAMDR